MTPLKQNPLAYVERLQRRNTDDIDLVVIHCTELPDLELARSWGENTVYPGSQTGNSGHFYIDRDGNTEQWVPLNRIAHHVKGHNDNSIGVELVNNGRYPHWLQSTHQQMQEPYPDVQIAALTTLLKILCKQLTSLLWISGHADLDTARVPAKDRPDIMLRRKLDPGPCFPWQTVLSSISLKRQVKKNRKAE